MNRQIPDLAENLERSVRSGPAGDDAAGAWDAFRALFEKNPQAMMVYDRKSWRFLAVNDYAVEKYGYTREEFLAMTIADIRPHEDIERLKQDTSGEPQSGNKVSRGWRHLLKNGKCIYVTIHSHPIDYQGYDAVLVTVTDVSELQDAIHQLEMQQAYFQQLFENSPEGIVLVNGKGEILDANRAFQRMFGYRLDELKGHTPLSLIVPEDAVEESLKSFSKNYDAGDTARMTSRRKRKDGELIDVEILAYPVTVNGEQIGVFAIYQDVTERQRALSEVDYRARHDALTGAFNRSEFEHRLSALIADSEARDARHAFLYLDLDQFKVINDTCGHTAGDRVLVEVSRLIRSCVRESDSVSRLGGDEFGVLLACCPVDVAISKAERLVEVVSGYQFVWEDKRFPLSVSIGIVEIGVDIGSVEHAMSNADAACYSAKEKGRNRYQLYLPKDADFIMRRAEMAWVSRLNTAIEENRFVLFYQEIMGLSDATQVRHREVLIRYRDDDGSLIAPGAFVPPAERYNFMPAIDRWVLHSACSRLAARKARGKPKEVLSVNVSGTTLSDEKFPSYVREVLDETGIPGSWLCFEITETAAISNLVVAQQFISEVKGLGCSIALDDFGSGMSSFNYLRSLAIDYLKIDGMFVKEMDTNLVDSAMTEAINNVGKVLGLKTIAEFVETHEVLERLRTMGVDYAQGYGVHKPELWAD